MLSPVLHMVHEHNEAHDCDLHIYLNQRVIKELAFAGHAECLHKALVKAQFLLDGVLQDAALTAFTTGGKPC